MEQLLENILNKAKSNPKKIVFPEATEERTLRAIEVILAQKIAIPVLLGSQKEIAKHIAEFKLNIPLETLEIHDPQTSPLLEKLATKYYELRKHKGITFEQAKETAKNIYYFGTLLVDADLADGLVSGVQVTTGGSIKPALEILRTKEEFHKVSGLFMMVLEERLLFFADCAINIDPTAEELAHIAIDSARTAQKFGVKPKVALLSYSTFSDSDHETTTKIHKALKIARKLNSELIIDGEMQVDSALVPEVAAKKCPKSQIQGDANVLIFPNLEAGNIAYKLTERLAKASALGPILQGLTKPINDLSRGCSFHDIVNVTAITSCES